MWRWPVGLGAKRVMTSGALGIGGYGSGGFAGSAVLAIPACMSSPLQPVDAPQRSRAVDVLRGVALLGIFTMNIVSFALPSGAYSNPMDPLGAEYAGPFEGMNRLAWWLAHLLAEQKFMALFSMLFGAGLVLQAERAERKGLDVAHKRRAPGFATIYYRRLLWLFVIGMLHAFLLWSGDVLVAYAICGIFLYPVRHWRAPVLIVLAVLILAVAPLLQIAEVRAWERESSGWAESSFEDFPDSDEVVDSALIPSQTFDGEAEWGERSPSPQEEVEAYRGSYTRVFLANARDAFGLQTYVFVGWTFWRSLGCMLLGMALARLGVLQGLRARSLYVVLVCVGYGVGLPLATWAGVWQIRADFGYVQASIADAALQYPGSLLTALGHLGLVMLLFRESHNWLGRSLAAAGRLPLSNYLAQSLVGTLVFFSWGLGQFGHWTRAEVYWLVPIVWAAQLGWSSWWTARFRFGPVEWVWRSLTYWKRQPMRLARATPAEAAAP